MTKTFSSTTDRYDLRLTEGTSRLITSNLAISLLLSCCFVVDLGSDHEVRSRYRLCSLARLSPVRDRNKDINRQLCTFHTKCARSPLLPVDSWLALEFCVRVEAPYNTRSPGTYHGHVPTSSYEFLIGLRFPPVQGAFTFYDRSESRCESPNANSCHELAFSISRRIRVVFILPNSFLNTNDYAR